MNMNKMYENERRIIELENDVKSLSEKLKRLERNTMEIAQGKTPTSTIDSGVSVPLIKS